MCYMKEEECKAQMDSTHSTVDSIDRKVDRLDEKVIHIYKLLWWILGMISAIFVTVLFFVVKVN